MTHGVTTKVTIHIAIMKPCSQAFGICKRGIAKTIRIRTDFATYHHVRERVSSNRTFVLYLNALHYGVRNEALRASVRKIKRDPTFDL
jgi:hypothetical protein